ncbi:MAG: extracellular solute-binding protein [Deltaproteobacteria bacterium]|jgi:iron(III) transport system substrate-binding protein|nr:extracellular solute-binding protein [Deltaproteobacteria bacterium]
MNQLKPTSVFFIGYLALIGLFSVLRTSEASAASASSPPRESESQSESINELYEKAKKEGGQLTLYIALSARSEEIILPLFKKRFPAIAVNHIDATSDKLVARVLAEQRGGRIIGDVFGGTPGYLAQMTEQKLLAPLAIPEAAAYPAMLKGAEWVATDMQYFIAGWNTSLVKKGDEPKQFEDFADPKWKGKLIAEPRDFQLLMGLAKRKYNSDEKAVELLKKIAANGVEFHKGHSQLIELLVAGQAPVCLTCYSHHFPPRMKKGAPILPLLSEGVGEVGGSVAILKGAPHPIAARLWARWAVSDEGQRAYAQAGETPAHPNVEPAEKVRPETTHMLTAEEVKEFPKYEKLWKGIFQIR